MPYPLSVRGLRCGAGNVAPVTETSPVAAASGEDGRASRWTGQQEKRRSEFVEAALLAIVEHGPDVSTEQIAARAGVARTRLYRHFGGSADLNHAIAARVEEMVVEALAPAWDTTASPMQIIRTAVTNHLTWMTEHDGVYRYLTRHAVTTSAGDNVVADVKAVISRLLMQLLDDFVVQLDLDRRLTQPLSFGMVGFVDAAAAQWVADPRDVSLDDMVELLSEWIWSSLDGFLRRRGIELDPLMPLAPAG